jgi:hypothetical protein
MWNPGKVTEGSTRCNADRAETAHVSVEAANATRGEMTKLCEDSITDLMADLMHLADREGMNPEELTSFATMNWRAER